MVHQRCLLILVMVPIISSKIYKTTTTGRSINLSCYTCSTIDHPEGCRYLNRSLLDEDNDDDGTTSISTKSLTITGLGGDVGGGHDDGSGRKSGSNAAGHNYVGGLEAVPKQECAFNEKYCIVTRIEYITGDSKTQLPTFWGLDRSCSTTCIEGCIIIGERTKLQLCRSCCQTSLCNVNNYAFNPNVQSNLALISAFMLLTLLLFTHC